jgi:hypothetical protein
VILNRLLDYVAFPEILARFGERGFEFAFAASSWFVPPPRFTGQRPGKPKPRG